MGQGRPPKTSAESEGVTQGKGRGGFQVAKAEAGGMLGQAL